MKIKPVKTAYVKLWGDIIGAVTWVDRFNYAIFEFDESFVQKNLDISPLFMSQKALTQTREFSFPDLAGPAFHGLPGLLTTSLPDDFGNSIIDSWLETNNRDPNTFNPVERLCYIGKRGIGALEFEPTVGPSKLDQTHNIDVEKLLGLAQKVLYDRTQLDVNVSGSDKENKEALLDILRVGTSAGGARAKAIVAIKDNNIISGQAEISEGYEHWILKFDGFEDNAIDCFDDPKGYGRVEYAYYLMTIEAGIEMTECKLLEENNRAHFLTKRFDRDQNEKIHMQSLSSLAHFDWNHAHSYEQIFSIIRELNLGYPAHEQQYKRMLFNVLACNMDDHVKNFSFLMDKSGNWSLSPAYDLVYVYDPYDLFAHQHRLSINGKQDNIEREDLILVGNKMEINNPDNLYEEVYEAVQSWPKFAGIAGVDSVKTDQIQNKLVNLVVNHKHGQTKIIIEGDLDDDMEI
ncbi:MAG: type II toxin-antitoxin system HipA family toxin [Desulfobacterales bacterium]|nr:type II toxin-antitoxin system HipA family toxin [Desulfobacterales bacterium]